MNFEAPKNTETKSELEKFEEELKGLSDNIYRKGIDKKISKIREQMSQKSAYDDEEYYDMEKQIEELESQKEQGYDGLYESENEEKYWRIRNKISENIKEINNLIDEHIKDLEDTVSQKSAYDDEEYYSLQERIETLKELKSTHNIYYLKQESELVGEDEVMQSIVEKNKERNILNSKEDNIVSLLREGFEEKELFYMVRKLQFKQFKEMEEQKELLVANQAEEKVEEPLADQQDDSSNAKVYEFDELLEDNAEPQKESEEIEMNEVGEMLKDIGAEDKEEAPRDIEIEEIDAILENPKLDSENKEDTNMYEIDDMLKERGIDIDEQKESVEPKIDAQKIKQISDFLQEANKSNVEQEASLSPEKKSIFNRLKESLKKEDTQKKILIFAIASGVGVIIPYASIAYYGGGLLGLGAGASVPLLELVGLGAHSAAIGGPVGAISIFKGLEKALKWKFIKAEDSQIEKREMENLVTTIEEVAKKENVL